MNILPLVGSGEKQKTIQSLKCLLSYKLYTVLTTTVKWADHGHNTRGVSSIFLPLEKRVISNGNLKQKNFNH